MRLRFILAFLLLPSLVLADIPAEVDVLVLGEVHDNRDAHAGQAKFLKDLKPKAVVFEMLSAADAERANQDPSRIADIWNDLPWPDFEIYAPIFDAMGDAAIVGAATDRAETMRVFEEGPAAVFGPEAEIYGLEDSLPQDEQTQREDLQFAAHCEAMPRHLMPGMVSVQRYRDARFAKAAIDALVQYGSPVAVITGNGHARTDWGVPAYIKRAAPHLRVHSIGFVEGDSGLPLDTTQVVPETERPDPCQAFEKT